ncbi:hypothetical protein [Hymenobacter arizonensis]|uniref:hypothetical protein n=1 Tax=Hymenobacter arizonensis TaxID=1227077 RepID=UPI000B81C039|nr:hypothetical protein [Hymenobacter arizonensis]
MKPPVPQPLRAGQLVIEELKTEASSGERLRIALPYVVFFPDLCHAAGEPGAVILRGKRPMTYGLAQAGKVNHLLC